MKKAEAEKQTQTQKIPLRRLVYLRSLMNARILTSKAQPPTFRGPSGEILPNTIHYFELRAALDELIALR